MFFLNSPKMSRAVKANSSEREAVQQHLRSGLDFYGLSPSLVAEHACYVRYRVDGAKAKFTTPTWVLECPCGQLGDKRRRQRFFDKAIERNRPLSHTALLGACLLVDRATAVRSWRDRNVPAGPGADGRPLKDAWHVANLRWLVALAEAAGRAPHGWDPLPFGRKTRFTASALLPDATGEHYRTVWARCGPDSSI